MRYLSFPISFTPCSSHRNGYNHFCTFMNPVQIPVFLLSVLSLTYAYRHTSKNQTLIWLYLITLGNLEIVLEKSCPFTTFHKLHSDFRIHNTAEPLLLCVQTEHKVNFRGDVIAESQWKIGSRCKYAWEYELMQRRICPSSKCLNLSKKSERILGLCESAS